MGKSHGANQYKLFILGVAPLIKDLPPTSSKLFLIFFFKIFLYLKFNLTLYIHYFMQHMNMTPVT